MGLTSYSQGQHSIKRFPTGKHSIERYPVGQHGIVHPASWYVQRTARKTAMPAFAVLLSSSMTVTSLGIPVSALAASRQDSADSTRATNAASLGGEPLTDEELIAKLLAEEGIDDIAQAGNIDGADTAANGDASESGKTDAADEAEKTDTSDSNSISGEDPDVEAKDADKSDVDGKDENADRTQETDDTSASQQPELVEPAQNASAEAMPPAVDASESPSSGSSSYTSVVDDGSTLDATVTELKVASRLLDAGWTPEMIAAAIGNMYAESGSNAASFDNMSGMFNYAYEVAGGLFQWTDCGSSPAALSSAGFTGLTEYAQMCGKDWRDATLQTEYFLKTWRDEWMERQTYYDSTSPEFANVDVSLAAFDESDSSDFDGDGIVDSRDSDIDGDGIDNDNDSINERVINGKTIRYAADSALQQAIKGTPKTYTEAEARQRVAELTFAFMAGYEGPSARVSHLDRRVAHALRMYPAILALQEAHGLKLTENASLVVASAMTMLGGTYVWGAESPAEKAFDCSGLTKWCYSLVGVDVDHYSETQYAQADQVYDVAQAVPGDILWKPGHVGIYIGNGTTVEAKGTNYGIVYGDASEFDAALHFSVLDEQSGEEEDQSQLQIKLKERAQGISSAIQDAADQLLK